MEKAVAQRRPGGMLRPAPAVGVFGRDDEAQPVLGEVGEDALGPVKRLAHAVDVRQVLGVKLRVNH